MSSGLRFKGVSADQVAASFFREGRMTSKRNLRIMRRVSKAVMKDSIAMAPVDEGNLEAAHQLIEKLGNSRRLEVTIEVGGIVDGVNVDAYAQYIHEGSWEKLGPKSVAKQARSSPGITVGKYYLTRALERHEEDFDMLLDEIVSELGF